MTEKGQPNQQPRDPMVQAILTLAKWGRERQERERNSGSLAEAANAEKRANAAYEGMTYEERGIAVYKKWHDGGLTFADMTRLEWNAWVAECRRESQRTDNFLWNCENHRHLLRRIGSIWKKLTEDERQALNDLLESCQWGSREVEQAKEIVETAAWFSKLGGR